MAKQRYLFAIFSISLALVSLLASGASALTINEYDVPTFSLQNLYGITAGPDGNVWFTEYNTNKIGKITLAGSVTEYDITTTGSRPIGITTGPDGNLWFTEYNANKIGKITTDGTVAEYLIPTGVSPWGITAGPDGNLWFTEYGGVGKVTTGGVITEYPVALYTHLRGIAAGPDDNLWACDSDTSSILKVTTSGVATPYHITLFPGTVLEIASAPPYDLWFSLSGTKLGRISTIDGSYILDDYPGTNSFGNAITVGPDGAIWFTIPDSNKIGRLTDFGYLTEYDVPTTNGWPYAITAKPDNTIWFTEQNGNKIGKITFTTHSIDTTVHSGVGSLSCTPNPVMEGTPSLCSILPSSGYHVDGVAAGTYLTPISIGPTSFYYFNNVTEDKSIEASFAQNDIQVYGGESSAHGASSRFGNLEWIQVAMNVVSLNSGDWIEVPTGAYVEGTGLTYNRNDGITVTLSGGWNSDFSANAGEMSVIAGNIMIEGTGGLIADNITIQ